MIIIIIIIIIVIIIRAISDAVADVAPSLLFQARFDVFSRISPPTHSPASHAHSA